MHFVIIVGLSLSLLAPESAVLLFENFADFVLSPFSFL